MSGLSSRAVFLSHASQDAEAARRMCDALRAAGGGVWFDQSELHRGDAWDARCTRRLEFGVLGLEFGNPRSATRPERSGMPADLPR